MFERHADVVRLRCDCHKVKKRGLCPLNDQVTHLVDRLLARVSNESEQPWIDVIGPKVLLEGISLVNSQLFLFVSWSLFFSDHLTLEVHDCPLVVNRSKARHVVLEFTFDLADTAQLQVVSADSLAVLHKPIVNELQVQVGVTTYYQLLCTVHNLQHCLLLLFSFVSDESEDVPPVEVEVLVVVVLLLEYLFVSLLLLSKKCALFLEELGTLGM